MVCCGVIGSRRIDKNGGKVEEGRGGRKRYVRVFFFRRCFVIFILLFLVVDN